MRARKGRAGRGFAMGVGRVCLRCCRYGVRVPVSIGMVSVEVGTRGPVRESSHFRSRFLQCHVTSGGTNANRNDVGKQERRHLECFGMRVAQQKRAALVNAAC